MRSSVAYSREGLLSKRLPAQFLIPEVLPIYNHFRTLEELNPVMGAEFKIKINSEKMRAVLQRLEIATETDCHRYITISIKDPENIHNDLTGLYTPSVHNIEKVHYHADCPEALLALITYLSVFAKVEKIGYVEWQVTSSDLIAQRLLKDWGFQIFGYLPAWEPKATLKQFEDVVIFGWNECSPPLRTNSIVKRWVQIISENITLHVVFYFCFPTFERFGIENFISIIIKN